MRKSIFLILATGILQASTIAPIEDPVTAEAQLKYRLLNSLLSIEGKSLRGRPLCTFKTGDTGPLTIGKWISWNLSFFESGKSNSIKALCKSKSKTVSNCELDFLADSSGEARWNCGFRFEVAVPSYKINLSTLTCTGPC